MLDFLGNVFNFMSRLGGFLAFIFLCLVAWKFWNEADNNNEEDE